MAMPEAGTSHIGPYELRGELGRGAMARVWRAWDAGLRREVAIKEPLFDPRLPQATLDEMARRFVAEGRASARLNHPNIVAVYAIDVWDGRPAIVMELVEGETLTSLLAAGPLSPEQTLSILDQLLDAVAYAHQHGVVHRDVKPDNIFVTTTGQVKLADFGVAHLEGEGATRLTMAGSVLGTPGYMSPEQALGEPIDARSDLFSIGVVGYEMLAGENPFAVGSPNATTLLYRIVHEPVPDLQVRLPGVPRPMAAALMAALAKNPDERPVSAEAMRRALRGGKAVAQPHVEAAPPETTAVRRRVTERTEMDGGADETVSSGGAPSWLPYVLVATVCILALVVAFVSASAGGGGGGGAGSAGGETQVEREADDQTTQGGQETSAESSASQAPEEPAEESSESTDATSGAAEIWSYDARDGESQGFSLTDPPYTLTVDDKGLLCLYDASGRRMDDDPNFHLDVSYLPEKGVARLEQGVTYTTFDEAWAEYTSTGIDCMAPVTPSAPTEPHPNRASDEGPYWCIVIDAYPTKDEAERVAEAAKEQYDVEVSVMRTLEWEGLFYWYLEEGEPASLGDGYCVVTGLSRTYQEVLDAYLAMSEVLGQPIDAQVRDAIANDQDNWSLLDDLSEIVFAGTRRYPAE